MNNEDIILPPNTPLMVDAEQAEALFGLSRTTLYGLAKTYPDFPSRSIGRSVRYLVPEMYRWFLDYPTKDIPINEKCRPVGAGRR